jgi:hypothetical protein
MSLIDHGLCFRPNFTSAAQIVAIHTNCFLLATGLRFRQLEARHLNFIGVEIRVPAAMPKLLMLGSNPTILINLLIMVSLPCSPLRVGFLRYYWFIFLLAF